MRYRYSWLLAATLLLPVSAVRALSAPQQKPVHVTVTTKPARATAGETVDVRVQVLIDSPFHIYGMADSSDYFYPTKVTLHLPAGYEKVGGLKAPAASMHADPTLNGMKIPEYEKSVTFTQKVRVPAKAKPGKTDISATIDEMACTNRYCLDPAKVGGKGVLQVVAAPAPTKPSGSVGAGSEAGEPVRAPKKEPVQADASVRPDPCAAGVPMEVVVHVHIAKGWHIYGLAGASLGSQPISPTKLVLHLPEGYSTSGDVVAPPTQEIPDASDPGGRLPVYVGDVDLVQKVDVPMGTPPGKVSFSATLTYYACNQWQCVGPNSLALPVVATVQQGAVRNLPPAGHATAKSSSGGGAPAGSSGHAGLLAFLLAAFLGGLYSIALPCVYPLIPLTIGFFAKGSGKQSVTLFRAFLFCAGLVITFTGLGFVLAPVLQQVATGWELNLFLFLLMAVLALSLLGMFDITLPSSLTNRVQAAGAGASFLAPVFMGVAFSLASFTCTVGVVGALIASAIHGGGLRPAAGMLSYSIGFAVPFFFLALFPMAVSALPRGGSWLNTMKVMLGFFEVCFAGYYLWRLDLSFDIGIGTWPIILSLWTVTIFLAGLYLLGKIRLPHDPPIEKLSVPRMMGALCAFVFALYLFGGLMGRVELPGWIQGLLPPRQEAYASVGGSGNLGPKVAPKPEFADASFRPDFAGLWWTTDYDKALAIGKRTGRKIFLNFTGVFCSNCRAVESGIMPRPEVRNQLAKMVLVELYTDITPAKADEYHTTTEMSERYRKLRTKRYRTEANPYYVVLSPEGKPLDRWDYQRAPDVAAFSSRLKATAQ